MEFQEPPRRPGTRPFGRALVHETSMFAGNVMAEEVKASESGYQQPNAASSEAAPSPGEILAASLPPDERDQPDAELALSYGRLGAAGITVAAVVAALI